MTNQKVTVNTLRRMKKEGEKITVLTAYDFPMAKLIDEAGVEVILVGDSLGMVVLGYDSTIPVTMEDMLHHVKAVTRGARNSLVVADMPFMSYHISIEDAMKNAARLIQEGGATSVKLEGGIEMAETIKTLVRAGIPVMGHIGLTPQSVNQMGGFQVQGKDVASAKGLIEDAKALEEAGAFAIVLECIPASLAKMISQQVNIPTIGIGAGVGCDGQVLVTNDMLGLYKEFAPKFVKKYALLGDQIKEALVDYKHEVKTGVFPSLEHSYNISEDLTKLNSLY
jgi:3-methyl-2-oxobutanoate hydroxymethyltransferase